MQVIHYPDDPRPALWRQPVLALGNFDGMHRGHLKIIERVRRGAEERGSTAVAMTFDPHPSKIVRPDKAPPLLMTHQQKLEALARGGMHGVAIVRFTPELARWDPETFVRSVLVEWLHVAEVWVGANFLFGHDRSGNFSLLRSLGARYGFRAEKIDPGPLQRLRRQQHARAPADCRKAGSTKRARCSVITTRSTAPSCRDRSAAASWDFRRRICAPRTSSCRRPASTRRRRTSTASAYPSITNIGTRPTFESGEENIIETHVLDFDKDLYGAKLRLGFVQRLRDEKKFDGVDALKAQIEADRARAKDLFDRMGL